ncbi:MAG: hypothetical protein JKY37_07465 [Nannocystaceae bacterium]|nr:hypothetical protein [Nannocystaceae bacterium]
MNGRARICLSWAAMALCGAGCLTRGTPAEGGEGTDESRATAAATGTDGPGEEPTPSVAQLSAGMTHTCALLSNGAVRCWGFGADGRLGYGNVTDVHTAGAGGDVNVGGAVELIAAGVDHTCALLVGGSVRCWGSGKFGRLGYGSTDAIGDDELPVSAGDVQVGGAVADLAVGGGHACALLVGGAVRCWGYGQWASLGHSSGRSIGDDETPASAGDVEIGGRVVHLAVGTHHNCTLLDSGGTRCWGCGYSGKLGYGDEAFVGNDELPADAGDVDVGGPVVQLAAGGSNTCALLETGAVRCWGWNGSGELGYGDIGIGMQLEEPASVGEVEVGGPVVQLAAGRRHTCAVLSMGRVRCWGRGESGRLGYGNEDDVGDDETPAEAGDVDVGGPVVQVTVGGNHTCALLVSGSVRCWGANSNGQLGYGHTESIGDNETPASAGDVPIL